VNPVIRVYLLLVYLEFVDTRVYSHAGDRPRQTRLEVPVMYHMPKPRGGFGLLTELRSPPPCLALARGGRTDELTDGT
jgi:hypothetical protein